MSWGIIAALITSGLIVGFVNTLAGGGTIISLSLFMFLGLPPTIANGTNRIAIVMQNLMSASEFKRKKILDFKKSNAMAIPTLIGSLVGALIAIDLNEQIMRFSIGVIMLVMLFFLLVKPSVWLKENKALMDKPVSWKMQIVFFLIGVYGGFIHLGVGYFILAAAVLGIGMDLIKANAAKVWIVLLYTPLPLIIFALHNHVHWSYGFIHGIGNVIGAYVASHYAASWGNNFVRWLMVMMILVFASDLLGIIDIKSIINLF